MHSHLLQDIGLCIVSATVLAYIARWTRQPLLLAYIGAGVVIGPIGFELIDDRESIETLAELGLAFLLFIVGLEVDIKKLLESGKAALFTTLVQVVGCAALGFGAAWLLGFDGLSSVYVGTAVAFSSTMIVVKLLSDRNELDTVAGRLTLAVLLLQDLFALVFLAIQPNLGGWGAGSPSLTMGLSVLKGVVLIVGVLLVSRHVLPPLFRSVAKSPEVLLVSAISWCFLVSYAAMKADFSVAMGALVAGVSVSAFPYSLDVVAKIRSLRDFFVTLFFVSLGMLIKVPTAKVLLAVAVVSGVVVLSRFITVIPAMRLAGYDNRTGILSSIHLSQISEFALVIVLIGISQQFKHIGKDVLSVVVLTLVVTSTLSTYLIQFSQRIASTLAFRAKGTVLEDDQTRETRVGAKAPAPIVLVGCFRVGSSLVHDLVKEGKTFSVIDFSPEVHKELKGLGVHCIYGDISHLDTLEHAGVDLARVLVCSISDDFLRGTDNRKVLESLRKLAPEAKIIVTANSIGRALDLYAEGADYVLIPRILSANHLLQVIKLAEAGDLGILKAAEIEHLKGRQEVVP